MGFISRIDEREGEEESEIAFLEPREVCLARSLDFVSNEVTHSGGECILRIELSLRRLALKKSAYALWR